VGGGALAPLLLCRELVALGYEVTAFTHHLNVPGGENAAGFRVVKPSVRTGCRWHFPERVLAQQVSREWRRREPEQVIVCGAGKLAGFLLGHPLAEHLLVWEFTNATPGNSHVCSRAIRRLSRCRAVLSPSESIDRNIRGTYGYRGDIRRLPFWIEPQPVRQHAVETPLADFIYLGRRDPEKGLFELIRATRRVSERFPAVRVLITGPGDDAPYRAVAGELGVADRVRFEFFPGYTDTLDALARCRYLVLPSYHEGYPLVLLEAAQFGVPFIATDVGSVKEVFGSANAGLIVPPGDADALADAMLSVLGETTGRYAERKQAVSRVFHDLCDPDAVRSRLAQALEKEGP